MSPSLLQLLCTIALFVFGILLRENRNWSYVVMILSMSMFGASILTFASLKIPIPELLTIIFATLGCALSLYAFFAGFCALPKSEPSDEEENGA